MTPCRLWITPFILPTSYLQANLRYTGTSNLQARTTVIYAQSSQLLKTFYLHLGNFHEFSIKLHSRTVMMHIWSFLTYLRCLFSSSLFTNLGVYISSGHENSLKILPFSPSKSVAASATCWISSPWNSSTVNELSEIGLGFEYKTRPLMNNTLWMKGL